MLKIFLWLKYLCKKKIVFLSMAAVSLCCALLIVVSSLFSGFIGAFERSAVASLGDVVLRPAVRFSNYPEFIERLNKLESVKAAAPLLSGQGLLHLEKGNVKMAKMILGIEPELQAQVTNLKASLLKQGDEPTVPNFQTEKEDAIGGYIGIGMITEPNELTDEYDLDLARGMIGERVVLTSGMVVESAAAERIKRKPIPFVVSDVIFTGVFELDESAVYLPIDQLQEKIYPNDPPFTADQVQIKLKEGVDANQAKQEIAGVWGEFALEQLGWGKGLIEMTELQTAVEMQSRYIGEIKKQLRVLMVIFGIISSSVIALVFCIFYMIVMTCRKDIAVISSCGAMSRTIALVFIGFGGFVGTLGSAAGIVFGYIITRNINPIEAWISRMFGLKLWKSSSYMFSEIPSRVDWGSVAQIVFFAILASAIGAMLPAIIAARSKPVEILRYE